ncbi:cadherin-related family member 5 [Xyrichtys novacula]|uniref:Cadherin-related family member 5 n=1 Tax=Xyrichtys novacula TaxID=13765 RepID=A0AAV1F6I3_XYRNO|nr:cadherin-related family member 5 [Xyrichtys novacula]
MAVIQLKWDLLQAKALVCALQLFLCLGKSTGMSGWGGCLDGQDVFASVRENSHWGEVVTELMADTRMEGVHWRLDGKDADWFFLDERYIRLNTSADKILDREVQGPFLTAELSCYEEEIFQSVYRIMVEVLNENDNAPIFKANTVRSLTVSELSPVDSVVFTVLATDADNDKIFYTIDQTSPDADYFKIILPNSGEVVLSKPLDYETKTSLSVTIHASEMTTAERFNTSTNITLFILDGDDQYPQFLPCMLFLQNETNRICGSPVYTVNVTEGEEDIFLQFSPGPVHAVDGDRGLNSPVSYAIVSGDDEGRFLINTETGEMRLVHGVMDRLVTPLVHLQVMAYQRDDPRKYSVATVLIRFVAVNRFLPEFEMSEYQGFVAGGRSPVSLVNTYGSRALMLHVQDQDFSHGFNPMIYYTFSPTSNHTDIYRITQEGLLIAWTDHLQPQQKYILEVMAIDQESGDATVANVKVKVLADGQPIPYGALVDERLTGCTVGKALLLSMAFMSVLGTFLYLVIWLRRRHKGQMDPLERGCVAQGKHPNVSLRWFQLLSHRSSMQQMEEEPYTNEELGTCNPSFSFPDNPSIYTQQDPPSCQGAASTGTTAASDSSFIPIEPVLSPVIFNNIVSSPAKSSSSSPTFHLAIADVSPILLTREVAASKENLVPATDASPEPPEELLSARPSSATRDATSTSPFTVPSSQKTQTKSNDPVTSPSSQSSIPYSHARLATAEIDKPICKPRVKTPPYSPLLSSPLPKKTSTPPPTPELAPVKAKLVHVDSSPLYTPPVTPEQTSLSQSMEVNEPCTSLDTPEHHAGATNVDNPCEDRRPSINSQNMQVSRQVGEEDDDGFLGDEDGDKNSDGEDELEPDEEELLRVMARCNPIFITFSK